MPRERACKVVLKTRKMESKEEGARDTQVPPDGLSARRGECSWPLREPRLLLPARVKDFLRKTSVARFKRAMY